MRQPVGERRPVVEYELSVSWALLDRGPEGVAGLPVVEYVALERGKVRLGGYSGVPGAWVAGRSVGAGWSGKSGHRLVLAVRCSACREDDAPAPARAYRGTTSLAAGFRRPLVTRL